MKFPLMQGMRLVPRHRQEQKQKQKFRLYLKYAAFVSAGSIIVFFAFFITGNISAPKSAEAAPVTIVRQIASSADDA